MDDNPNVPNKVETVQRCLDETQNWSQYSSLPLDDGKKTSPNHSNKQLANLRVFPLCLSGWFYFIYFIKKMLQLFEGHIKTETFYYGFFNCVYDFNWILCTAFIVLPISKTQRFSTISYFLNYDNVKTEIHQPLQYVFYEKIYYCFKNDGWPSEIICILKCFPSFIDLHRQKVSVKWARYFIPEI